MDFRLLIARRYLVSRKQVTLISVITGISIAGVALGVASLIVVLSVMNGFYDIVRELLVSLDPHVRIVSAEGKGITASDTLVTRDGALPQVEARGLIGVEALMDLALATPHVEHAAAYVEGKALLVHEGSGETNVVVIVRGVDPATLEGVSDVVGQTGYGQFDLERSDGLPGIVMGMSLGQRLALAPGSSGSGSRVALLSAPAIERMLTRVFGAPALSRFEVRGLYQLEDTYDNTHVFIGLEEAQRLFRMDGTVSGIELRLDDLNNAGSVKAALQQHLDPDRYTVHTWYDLQKSLYDVMRLEKWGASIILILICVVAAFNIIGSLTMVVIEKRRDVGVLQAMGVSRRNVRRIFLLEGVLIGVLGAGVGFVIGLSLSFAQKYFALVPLLGAESFMIDAYPVSIRLFDLVVIGTVSFALCVLASLYPAARAAAIEPAHAVQMDR